MLIPVRSICCVRRLRIVIFRLRMIPAFHSGIGCHTSLVYRWAGTVCIAACCLYAEGDGIRRPRAVSVRNV